MFRNNILIVIPTYNEIESLAIVINNIFDATNKVDILIVDDNSPDGTGKLADELSNRNKRLNVLHQKTKNGLGIAYINGFKWGIEKQYKFLCEMDADGSHQTKHLITLIEQAKNKDVGLVIGSRWVKGGSVVNWPVKRKILSRIGNYYIKIMMKLPVKDATGGYRVYKAETLKSIDLDSITSKGFVFQIDMTERVLKTHYKIIEYPIEFIEREKGESKMSGNIITEALSYVTKKGIINRLSFFSKSTNKK